MAQLSWFPGLWPLFECGFRSFDLYLISYLYYSPALPRHIFKTACQHIVEQHRNHIGLRQRLRRGTMGLVRSLSLGTAQSPQVDIEGRPSSQRVGSIRPFTKPLITRVDTIPKPIDPSGQPSSAVEPVVPKQLTESPAQAPILLSPMASRSSTGQQVNTTGNHPEVTPGDHPETWLPDLLTTTSPRGLESPLSLGGTPQTMHASANASGVGFRQTETLRQRKSLATPLTKPTFSERHHS